MQNSFSLVEVSALSGLVGAILTQTFTGVFAYFGDKRKAGMELRNLMRAKKTEIAENYYYACGESMIVLRESIDFWKAKNVSRGKSSTAFMAQNVERLEVQLKKLNTENWKQNLVGLYFNLSSSYEQLIADNARSKNLYLTILDVREKLLEAEGKEKELLMGKYHMGIFDLCEQYESIYKMLEKDMGNIKTELLRTFQPHA